MAFNAPEKRKYEVLVEVKNGGRIAGRRRAVGDVVEMTASEAEFLALDGVIREQPAPAPAPVVAKRGKNDSEV